MDDMDMIFLYQSYFTETDLSFLEGIDKKVLTLSKDQAKVDGETLILNLDGSEKNE